MHPGLLANLSFRRLDPLVRPTLQRLAAQKPHLLDEPLFGRVRLPELSVQVPHRAHYRRQSIAKTRMGLKKRQKRFVAEFHRRHKSNSLDCRIARLLPTRLNRTLEDVQDEGSSMSYAQSADRVRKERAMRRRHWKWLWARLGKLATMNVPRE